MTLEVTKQNLELLVEALMADGCEWTVWYAPHLDQDGASLHFGNGCEMSLRWGLGNYWSGRMDVHYDGPRTMVEVALFDKRGEFVKLGAFDDVLGWQTFDEIAALAQVVANGEASQVLAA